MRINKMISNGKMLFSQLISKGNVTRYWGLKSVKKLLVGEVLRIPPEDPRVLLAKE